MKEARPFLYVKNAGIKAFPVPVASARPYDQLEDRAIWNQISDADGQAYRKAHEKSPSTPKGKTAYILSTVHAALLRLTRSRFLAGFRLAEPGISIVPAPCITSHLQEEFLSIPFETGQSASPRGGLEIAEKRPAGFLLSWPDQSRAVRMRTRANQADSRISASRRCANPEIKLFKLPVQRTEEWRNSVNARKLSFSLWFSLALVLTLISNTQPMLAAGSATTTTLALTSGAGAVTTVSTGSVITLTAKVVVTTGGAALNTGRVNFCDSGYPFCTDIHLLGTAQLTSAGTAVLKLVPAVGNHSYQAVFLGTASRTTSVSSDSLLTVTGKYQTTTLISQSGTVNNYTLNAVVAGQGLSSPTGQVSFLDSTKSNAVLGSGTLVANPADYLFLNVQSPATGHHPNSVAVGDFNGDGIPDMAVANRLDNTVTILLGNGDGTFRASGISPPTGKTPVAVVSGDFNGDGKADLAVANSTDGTVSILLGNGDGTFTLKASPVTGNNPAALAVGDFNGDGKADLAVANNSSNSVTMLLGNGDGTFTATTTNAPTGHSPTAIAAGDFNEDGRTDLVVVNGTDNSVTILLGKGNGTFTVVPGTVPTGRSPQSIIVADFNEDGWPDIAVVNALDNNLSVYQNTADGSGGFNLLQTYPTGNSPNSVMVGDFDGDGNPDLAVANSSDSTLTVFLGDGQGDFNATAINPVTGSDPWSIAVADFNGDGYSDIASANLLAGTATVLLSEEQTSTAAAGPISVAGLGPQMAVASYPGDSAYSASISSGTPLYTSTPTPVISPPSGVYTAVQSATITDSLAGAAIYYSIDGSTPTSASTLYTAPFPVSTSEIVQAIAVGSGYGPSAVVSSAFTLNLPPAPTPVIHLASGTYAPGQTVTISDSTSGNTIYYTTNGSIPSPGSTGTSVYAGPISLSSSETLVAAAIAPGYSLSAPVSAQYIITGSSASFIYSISGNGNAGYQGDGGLASLAGLNSPEGSVFDSAGNLYIADTYNNLVRKVTAGTGVITTVAGTATAGYSGDGLAAVNAQLNWPVALALDSVGNLFIADSNNFAVRRVDAKTGIITSFAGNGTLGNSGNGGPAASAQLSYVDGIAFDGANNLYIADSGNSQVWEVLAATSAINVVAGNGTPGYSGDSGPAIGALLNSPNGVAVDHAGNVYIADKNNNAIREIAAGTLIISTVAGDGTGAAGYVGDPGPATSAEFDAPLAVTVDAAGDLFIADSLNSVIRRVDANTKIISTVAGNGSFCSPISGDGGPALSAGLCYPNGISVDAAGNLYIADSLDQRIRIVAVASAPPTAAAAAPAFSVTGGTYGGPQTAIISDATPGASIYITMDGTTPTALSAGYLGPINVSGSVTVKAIAIAPGYQPSPLATAAYTINYPPVALISTVAGDGVNGFNGAGGAAASAEFGYLQGLALDGAGNLYMADTGNNVVWMFSPATGKINIVAGNGTPGYSGDSGPATSAQLYYPSGPAADQSGNLYIADSTNNVIRLVTAASQVISTFAGNGTGSYSGDGMPAISAELANPTGVAVDSTGNVYIADSGNSRVRMVSQSSGLISTFAGDGLYVDSGDGGPAAGAGIQQPVALAFDNSGNLFIAEENGRIRRVDAITKVITSVAGNGDEGYSGDGGLATNAEISEPTVAFDQAGNLYISSTPAAVREVSAATGMIATVAGTGLTGFTGDGGSATVAELDQPAGVVVDAAGNLYVADANNFRVRKVTFPTSAATPVFSLPAGSYINTRQVTVTDGTTGAAIYYTTDGTTPTEASTLYSGQIAVTASETLQAIAVAKGYAASAVASAAYIIIPPSTPVITWPTPSPITYGTTLSATQLDATTTVTGTWVYTPAAGALLTAGSQTLSVTFTPNDLVDYTTATASVTLMVNQVTPVITWATPAAITYGTVLSAAQLNATASVPGNFVYTPALGTTPGAGQQTLSVTFTPTDATDYTTATATVSLTVNQAIPAITWATPAAITYGTALGAAQLNASSTVQGTFVYSPVAGTVLTAGPQTLSVAFTPKDTTDYIGATATVSLTVNQATPTITWAAPAAITYGTALSGAQLNAVASVTGNLVYTPALGATLNAGQQTLSVTFTPTDSTDYTTATATVTMTVNKATPTITWAAPAAITYGTALSATQLNATPSVPGNLVYTPVLGATPSAGQQTLSVTLTPTDSTDYTTATATVTLTVNKATPSITWAAPAAITYGTPLSTTQLNASSTVAGNFAYTPSTGALLGVGPQTLSVTLTPTDSNDYTTATATVLLTVNQATPSITWATPAAITYGTALGAAQLNASSTVQGTYVYNPAAGTTLGVGAQTLSVTFTPNDLTDYTTATATVTLTVNKATPTISWATPAAITYGTALSGAQLNATASVAGNLVYTPALGATPNGGQQTLSVTFTPTDSTDYTTATATVTLTVTKATPTITWAAPAAITYGTALSATQLNATASVAGNFVYTPALGATPGAGQQTLSVTFTPTDSTDYATATATVTLTVNKATPTVNWTAPAAITYGTPLSGTQLNASSTVAGTYVYTPAAGAILAAGPQTLSTTLTPTDSTDYTTATASVSLTVSPATPSVAVILSSPSITTTQSLQVTVNVSGAAGATTPTGTVTLFSASYSAQQTLSGGSTTFAVPAGSLPVGIDTLTAVYAPDVPAAGSYNGATQSTAVSVLQAIGSSIAKVTATPSATPITDMQPDTVTVSVAGGSGAPTPTGMVTLASGAYSAQQALVSGTATFTIPAGSLASGANTLTATYSGDATFAIATGSTTVTVSPFVIEVPAISAITPGGDGTATITATAGSTYSGTIDLSCALTGSPAGAASLPTCSFNPPTLTLTPGGTGTSVLTVTTIAATTAFAQPAGNGLWGMGSGVVLAAMLMFGIPSRRRRWLSMVVLLFVVAAAGAIGCGGHSSSGGGGTGTPGTTAGTYTFTLTATDSVTKSVTTSTTVSVTVQ